jgi:NDP-sugar pyrophosphorylase family protein
MKIVVFAAGEGVRMRPLTLTTPKPLLKYRGETNLDHLFALLPAEIDEAIITVKYLGEQIKAHCGSTFHGRTIHYVDGSAEGNAIGFLGAKNFFAPGERFAICYGDEVFDGDEIARCFQHQFSWICYPVEDPTKTGVATVDESGKIIHFVEKPKEPESNLAADGFMVVNADIFNYPLEKHPNGEYYFSDLMKQFIKNHDVYAVMGDPGHGQLTTPADIDRLNSSV